MGDKPGTEGTNRTAGDRRATMLIPIAVGILTVLAVIGAAAHGDVRLSDRGPLAEQRAALLAVGLLLLAVDILVIISIRRAMMRRRRPRPDFELPLGGSEVAEEPWWAKVLTHVIFLALLAVPVLLIYLGMRNKEVEPITEEDRPRQGEPPNELPEGSELVNSALTVMMLLSLVAIIVAIVITRRQLGPRRRTPHPFLDVEADADLVDEDVLDQAVTAGAAAIRSTTDPRQAIIACYAAMEATLAQHGARRRAADTPGELLDRAAAAGLVRSDAVRALTDLFRRARFSDHPISTDGVAAARAALARLRADLGVRT